MNEQPKPVRLSPDKYIVHLVSGEGVRTILCDSLGVAFDEADRIFEQADSPYSLYRITYPNMDSYVRKRD